MLGENVKLEVIIEESYEFKVGRNTVSDVSAMAQISLRVALFYGFVSEHCGQTDQENQPGSAGRHKFLEGAVHGRHHSQLRFDL